VGISLRGWPLLLISSLACAQGILPPQALPIDGSTVTVKASRLLVGQRLPETLTVQDLNGHTRTLVSYKAPLEILVLFFFSTQCPKDPAYWRAYSDYYAKFKTWHASFIAISTQPNEHPEDVAAALKKAGMEGVAVVRDAPQATLTTFHPAGFPWLIILDEEAHLRYRGPLKIPTFKEYSASQVKRTDAYQAIDDIIGHVQPVTDPEPPGQPECPLP
jgi:hypothetical protein